MKYVILKKYTSGGPYFYTVCGGDCYDDIIRAKSILQAVYPEDSIRIGIVEEKIEEDIEKFMEDELQRILWEGEELDNTWLIIFSNQGDIISAKIDNNIVLEGQLKEGVVLGTADDMKIALAAKSNKSEAIEKARIIRSRYLSARN